MLKCPQKPIKNLHKKLGMTNLTKELSDNIVGYANNYLGTRFCFTTFNCVHFVRQVYCEAGIIFPLLNREAPPRDFHLTVKEFAEMPIGHSVFFKCKKSTNNKRIWTHVAIIVGKNELIHCTRNSDNGVVITPRPNFLERYRLVPSNTEILDCCNNV